MDNIQNTRPYSVYKTKFSTGSISFDCYDITRVRGQPSIKKDLTLDEALSLKIVLNSSIPEYVIFFGLEAARALLSEEGGGQPPPGVGG